MTNDNGDKPARSVGNMNGGWAILFKICLATYPLVVGGCAYLFQLLRDHDQRIIRLEATNISVDYRVQLMGDIQVLKTKTEAVERRIEAVDKKLGDLLERVGMRN